jgi:hypothetical protein
VFLAWAAHPGASAGSGLHLLALWGRGELVAGERDRRMATRAIGFVPPGKARGPEAETRVVALHVAISPTIEADRAEVTVRLKE